MDSGCRKENVAVDKRVRQAGLRPTRQRIALADLLFAKVEGSKTYFDTNTSDHHHFYVEGENRIFDIASGPVSVSNLPEPPEGMEIANVDIVVRLRPKRVD